MADLVGVLAGVLCAISFFPQVIKVYRTKQTADLSIVTFSLFAAGIVMWLVYGYLMHSLPIMLANGLMLAFVAAIVFAKIRYR